MQRPRLGVGPREHIMSDEHPPRLWLRARGELACFSRPEFSVERTSYPWITPSAARGLFEAVLWKPRLRWEVREVRVLSTIRFLSVRRNEVGLKAKTSGLDETYRIDCDEERQQRTSTLLQGVEYVLGADLFLNPEVEAKGEDDNHGKYREMFIRRLAKGQHFHQPYLGCREFAADLGPASGNETAIPVDYQHGLMLYDFRFPTRPDSHRDWADGQTPRPLYFDAQMKQGVVAVPSRAEVLQSLPRELR